MYFMHPFSGRNNQTKVVSSPVASSSRPGEAGFSLIEVAVAMVVILVALLGVFATITYAITYNMGNNSRAQAIAVLQQEVERLRSKKFTPALTDPALVGGSTTGTITANGLTFSVTTVINNDPTSVGADETTTSFKEITITSVLASPSPGWQTALPARVILRRVKSN